MSEQTCWQVTRRHFLFASFGFLIPRVGWSANIPHPILAWSPRRSRLVNSDHLEASSGTIIAATGRLEWVPDGSEGELPRLDGYSVWFEQELQSPVRFDRELSVSAWLALEAFPVNKASIVEWGDEESGVTLAVDRLGFPLVTIRSGDRTLEANGSKPLDHGRWLHVAASLSANGALTLYVNGAETARTEATGSSPALAQIGKVWLGRARDCEIVAKAFPTGVLNGLLRDVRVYKVCVNSTEAKELAREFQVIPAPLATNPAWFDGDTQRPRYHAMPPRAWTNEPHGLVHWRGEYHLFYQKNPDGPYWGHIHWGHMTSPDLLHWTEQPLALTPESGPDSEGCWSGSAIVVADKLHLIYTGGDGKRSSICLATSEDGIHFTKYPGNPVIETPPAIGFKEFRDPFIWKQGAEYRMIIGSGIDGVGGTALLYRSNDLTSWQFIKPLLIGDKQSSGVFWEMPIFVPIGTFHVLIVCEVPGRASYWVGTWADDEFRVFSNDPHRLDLFNHFLSPTPYIDDTGRVIMMGIVPDSRNSREAWQAGWAHLYGLPRELTLDAQGVLQQRPFSGLQQLFTELVPAGPSILLTNDWHVCEGAGTCLKINATFERGRSQAVVIALRRSPDNQEISLLRYEWDAQRLTLDRSKSSLNPNVFQNLQQASYGPSAPGQITFEIFLDQSVLEVFIDSRACFSTRIYPVLPESAVMALRAEGGDATLMQFSVSACPAMHCLQIAKWNSPYQITNTRRHNPDARAPRNALALRA
jgi:beta-fructofuranosidase